MAYISGVAWLTTRCHHRYEPYETRCPPRRWESEPTERCQTDCRAASGCGAW